MKTEPDGQTVCLSLMVPEWPARQEKAASAIDLLTALSGPGNDILTSACENSGNEKPNADRTKTAPSQRSDFHEVIKPEAESRSSAVNQPSLQQSDPSRGDEQDRHLDPHALKDSPTDRLPQEQRRPAMLVNTISMETQPVPGRLLSDRDISLLEYPDQRLPIHGRWIHPGNAAAVVEAGRCMLDAFHLR